MSQKEITLEELLKKLEAKGLKPGQWAAEKGGGEVKVEMFERHRKVLERVGAILEEQIKKDHETRMRLQESLHRLQHGGGM
jgi:DNA-binding PadR family transcriptional regulator